MAAAVSSRPEPRATFTIAPDPAERLRRPWNSAPVAPAIHRMVATQWPTTNPSVPPAATPTATAAALTRYSAATLVATHTTGFPAPAEPAAVDMRRRLHTVAASTASPASAVTAVSMPR